MRDHLRRLQEMGSELLGLIGLGKSAAADKPVTVPIDVARRQRETASASDAELVEFLDQCVEAKEIQRLHYATGEAVARLVAGDFESRTASVVARQGATIATPGAADSLSATVSNLRELRPRVANPFDTANTLIAEAAKKVDEGRRESEARIKTIAQRADELSTKVDSLRGEVASRDSRLSELEQKLEESEQAKEAVTGQLEEERERAKSVIRDASVNEAVRKSQIRSLRVSLVIAGAVIIALLFVLARVNL